MGEQVTSIDTGAPLWIEDECAPDAESLSEAWARLFAEPFEKRRALKIADEGDAISYEMPGGYVAVETGYRQDVIFAPRRRVPAGCVQTLMLNPGKNPVLFDMPANEVIDLRCIKTEVHHHGMFGLNKGERHYAAKRDAYELVRGTLYVMGPYGQSLPDCRAHELMKQYSYTPREQLEWALRQFAEKAFDVDIARLVQYLASEAYGLYGECSACHKAQYHRRCETEISREYGFDLGSYDVDVCLNCGDRLTNSAAVIAQEERSVLRALRIKPVTGKMLIAARRVLCIKRAHLADLLKIKIDDIVDWEERDELGKAPVEWFIDRLAKTGVWG